MKILHLKIQGRIPAKKNNRRNYGRTSLPSENYVRWHTMAAMQIIEHKGENIEKCDLQFEFWMPDNRVTDLDNKVSSLLDLFKDLGIIKDDCWQCVPSIYMRCAGIDKLNPRVKIWIKELK